MAPSGASRFFAAVLAGSLLAGCAADEGRRRDRSARASGDRAGRGASEGRATWGERPAEERVEPEEAAALAPSRTLRRDRFATIVVDPPAAEVEARPRRRRSVDVDLQRAPFEDVARMLADVGGFGLVVEAPAAGSVEATLRQVDAWDALVAICEAKGLDVRYERGIAIVKSR